MEKSEWYKQRKALQDLLVLKEKELKKVTQDIEEINYTIECYAQKVGDYVPEEPIKL